MPAFSLVSIQVFLSLNFFCRMKTTFSCLLLLWCATIKAQYYYNDIVDAGYINQRMSVYTLNKVTSVSAAGFDPQGAKTTDFNELQEIDGGNYTLKISTRNGQQVKRQYYQFDSRSRLLTLVDSSGDIKSSTVYKYNDAGQLISLITTTADQFSDFNKTEEHQWIYDANGNPTKMWRIRNAIDSAEFRFTIDEKGNVADEQHYRRGASIDQVYYYYNESNQLTDIVRYDKKIKQLLPDFMFEYDEKNRLIQKITVLSTTHPDYLIWRYLYNEKGLKTKEALFNKDKELRGRIEYSYTFAQ